MYFLYPFGVGSTPAPIPATASPNVLSYEYGFGNYFELPLNTNPNALPIPRVSFNQLMNDITSTLQTLYQYGTPPWITAAENGGVSFPYPIYARVYWVGEVWENQVANNTVTPGTMGDESWLQISAQADSILPGTVIDYAGTSIPVGYLACNGNSVPRAMYPDLFAAITFVQSGSTTGTTAVTGLTNMLSLAYVGMVVEGTNITPGTTIAAVVSNTQITLSATTTGTGTNNVTFFPFGNAGTTVFNLPNLNDQVVAGAGGTLFQSGGVGNAVGNSGGSASYMLQNSDTPPHVHVPTNGLTNFLGNKVGGAAKVDNISGTATDTSANTGDVAPTGRTQTAISLVQQTTLLQKIIKT